MPIDDRETITTDLDLPPPVDLPASLTPLGRWGDDLIDRWDGMTLVRTVRSPTETAVVVPFSAVVVGNLERPTLRVTMPSNLGMPAADAMAEIRQTFVTDRAGLAELAAADERISRLDRLYPGLTPVLVPDPFTALIRSISAQQVNLRWAAIIRRCLAEQFGIRHDVAATFVYSLHPAPLADASLKELRALQLTNAKARSVVAVARAAAAGELERARLESLDDESLIRLLIDLPGIGLWSAEWFLARTLGRPRVVAGDLGVRKAVGRLYGLTGLPSEDDVRRMTAHWGRAATFAQALALYDLAGATGSS